MNDTPVTQSAAADPHGTRQARREQISALLTLVSARKVLTYAESEALRFLTAAEQIDGDQAREQRDEAREEVLDARNVHEGARLSMSDALGLGTSAPWATIAERARELAAERDAHETHRLALAEALRLGAFARWEAIMGRVRELTKAQPGGKALTASDVLVQHDVTRKALCDALGAGYHLGWQQIIDTAQRSHTANAGWQREVEQLRRALAEVLAIGPGLSDDDLIACVRDVLTRAETAEHAMQSTAADALAHRGCHRKLMAQCQRAETAETEVKRLGLMVDEYAAGARGLSEKLRAAQATLTAARQAVSVALQHENPLGLTCQCGIDHLGAITAALGDPQPATEPAPDPCDAFQPPAESGDSGLCARCGMYDYKHAPADPCAHGCRDAADEHTRLSQEIDAEQDGLYLRLYRILGLPADTTDDALIETVRGLLVRDAREQPAEPLLRGTPPEVHVHVTGSVTPQQVADAVRRIIRNGGGGR